MKRLFHSSAGVWAHRDVRIILPARTVALAGNAMAIITLLLQAHDRGAGTVGVAALLVCLVLPAIALMGLSGRLADTHDSRTLLAAGIGVQVAALVVLAYSPSLPMTLAGAILLELGQAVIGPVWTGLLPRVVGEGSVGQVIAWQQGLGAVAGPIGAAAGGVIYGSAGATPSLLGAAGAFGVLWLAAWAIRTRRHLAAEAARATGLARSVAAADGPERPADDEQSAHDDVPARDPARRLLPGLAILRHDALVWPVILALLPMVVLLEGVNAVEVFLARDVLQATPAQYGLGELAAGAGGVLGALIAGRLRGDRAWVRGTIYGFALASVMVALAGGAPSFWVYLGLMVGVSGAAGVANAANGALVVTRTADAQRGTVGATLAGLARTGSVVALAVGGLVGTVASPRAVFICGGLAGTCVVLAIGWRAVRASSRPAPEPVPA